MDKEKDTMNRGSADSRRLEGAAGKIPAGGIRRIAGGLLTAMLIAVSGCEVTPPVRELGIETPPTAPPLPSPVEGVAPPSGARDAEEDAEDFRETVRTESAEIVSLEGSGEMVWAEGFVGVIAGLDGELYEAYLPVTIERIQEVLRARGLYAGPVNGILDAPTMQAILAFQEASYALERSGIPSPRTRRLLEQGSHTS